MILAREERAHDRINGMPVDDARRKGLAARLSYALAISLALAVLAVAVVWIGNVLF